MQVVGKIHVAGGPCHQRKACRDENGRHNRRAVEAVGQVDGVAGTDDNEVGQQDIEQPQLRHYVFKERHHQLGCRGIFPRQIQREGHAQAITDIQKYFQRAIRPLVSLRTTLR